MGVTSTGLEWQARTNLELGADIVVILTLENLAFYALRLPDRKPGTTALLPHGKICSIPPNWIRHYENQLSSSHLFFRFSSLLRFSCHRPQPGTRRWAAMG